MKQPVFVSALQRFRSAYLSALALLAAGTAVFTTNAQTLSQKWENTSVATGHRDIAYNPATGNILVAKTDGNILRFSSADGSSSGANLDNTGILGGTFALSGVTATKGGTIFACNYVTGAQSTSPLKIYRWADENSAPEMVASLGTLPGATTDRFGQNLNVYTSATTTNLLVAGNATTAFLVIYDGNTWTFKQLTCDSQVMTPTGSFVDYNAAGFANKFRVVAKSRGSGGQVYNFDPTTSGTINLAATANKTAMTGGWAFIANGITSHDYDPATGLLAGTTSTTQSTAGPPYSYTNIIFATTNGLAAPTELSRVTITSVSTADVGQAGGTAWGTDGRLYTFIPTAGAGLRAFDVSAFLISAPANATKVAGQNVAFSSVFGGSGLTYTWQKDSVAISNDSKYSGATNATLTVNNLVSADAGTYTVTATDANGGTATASAVLTMSPSKAWTGAGSDDNFSTAANWGGTALATSGETAVFAGNVRPTPLMDGSYDVTGLLFNNTAGAFTLNSTAGSTLTLSGSLVNESANAQTVNVPVVVNAAQNIDIAAPVNISGSVSGSGTLTKVGSSTLTLSGTNTHNGAIAINAGALSVTNGSAIGDTSPVTLATGGTLTVDSAETVGSLSGSASTVVLNGKLTLGGSGATYTGAISGTNDLEIAVSGTQANNSATTYTGKTILTAGTLSANDSTTFGNGTGVLQFNGGTLFRASQSAAQTWANPINVTADSVLAGNPTSGTRQVIFSNASLTSTGGTLTITNTATSGTGVLQVRFTATSANCNFPIVLSQGAFGSMELLLTNNATGNQTISGNISGTGKVIKNGTVAARQATITGNNSFSGGFQLLGGRANLNNNNAAGTGVITIGTNSTIELSSTVPGIVITNDIVLSAGVAGGPSASPILYATSGNGLELAGVISGADSIANIRRNDTGAGTLTLSGANTFAGGLTISSRALTLKNKSALGTGTLTIGDAVTAPATGINLSAGIDLTGANALANAVTINQNFTISGSGLEFNGPVTLTSGATRTITLSGASSFGRISGTLNGGSDGLIKAGAGTLELSGNNAYSGTTTISAGKLRVNSSLTSGSVSIAATGTLSGVGPVSDVALSGTIAPGTTVGTLATGNQTWEAGGHYAWEMNDATAGAGFGWDKVAINGTLTINATSANKFNVDVASLSGSVAGEAANFNPTVDQTWTILTTTGGITGFDATAFNVMSTGFSNSLSGAQFGVRTANGGKDLVAYLIFPPQNFGMSGAGVGTFTGQPNTSYTVQYTDSLSPINWQTLATITTDGTGFGSFSDPGPLPSQRFYRVLLP